MIGAYPLDADDVAMLSCQQIDRVLNLVQDSEYSSGEHALVEQALHDAGIEEYRLEMVDYGNLPAEVIEAAVVELRDWLEQGHRVYMHCRAGWQRSAALAAAIVAVRENIDIDDALAAVQSRKPSADPLPHQREDLRRWWEARRGQAAPAPDG